MKLHNTKSIDINMLQWQIKEKLIKIFKIASKIIKYLGINLTKVKDLCIKTYKTLIKEIEEDKINGKIFCAHGLEESMFKMFILLNLQIQYNFDKSSIFFKEIE